MLLRGCQRFGFLATTFTGSSWAATTWLSGHEFTGPLGHANYGPLPTQPMVSFHFYCIIAAYLLPHRLRQPYGPLPTQPMVSFEVLDDFRAPEARKNMDGSTGYVGVLFVWTLVVRF